MLASAAFAIVFGIFVVAFVGVCVLIASWAIRRDKARWREWQERRER